MLLSQVSIGRDPSFLRLCHSHIRTWSIFYPTCNVIQKVPINFPENNNTLSIKQPRYTNKPRMTGLTPKKKLPGWIPVAATMVWSVPLKTSTQLPLFFVNCTVQHLLSRLEFKNLNSYVLTAELISLVLPSSFIHPVHQFEKGTNDDRPWDASWPWPLCQALCPSSRPAVALVPRGVLSSLYSTCALLSISSQNTLDLESYAKTHGTWYPRCLSSPTHRQAGIHQYIGGITDLHLFFYLSLPINQVMFHKVCLCAPITSLDWQGSKFPLFIP